MGQLICKLKLPAGCDNTLVIYKKLLKLSEFDVENAIMSGLRSNLFLTRSVHIKCHKTIDRDLGFKEKKHWRKEIKKQTNKELYRDIVKFRENVSKQSLNDIRNFPGFELRKFQARERTLITI